MTKLRIVRKYYPELRDVTYSEIVAEYNVDTLYDNLGRRQLKRLAPVTQSQLRGARESSKRSRSRGVAA